MRGTKLKQLRFIVVAMAIVLASAIGLTLVALRPSSPPQTVRFQFTGEEAIAIRRYLLQHP